MAEPTNTPVPASTPRSTSPAPRQTPIIPNFPNFPSMSSPGSPVLPTKLAPGGRPKVLHIGDPIKYNPDTYALFSAQCDIVRPSAEERERPEFIRALKEHRWGDFHAIFRPFWGTGGEMGLWDSELVDLLPPTVRVFASAGAGFDWADTKLLGERGIIYCNSGLAAAEAVADFAVAMIISTFRQLAWCINAAQSDDPADFSSCHRDATAQARNLRGNVLGVIGLGNIGQQVASRCHHGFGMVIHYYDVVRLPAAVEEPLGGARRHDSLQSLLAAADCVVLCAPATPPGEGDGGPLIGAKTLGWFPEGGRFVNVARGSLVDDAAVADALESGRLSSAALDVHPDEPNVHPRLRELARKGKVMITCHNAGGTVDTHKGFEELSMRNIMAVLAGGKAITPVNMRFLKS
ncbi:unnamed protein product [Clonostachys rosea f. rosea IK726]|uniref:Uncharacterized protein n=1 Tax=Clonostachys rosea f. rosea IK726 TaxID=1349383 RepID=A0ACA9THK9_BIOOC|nr:unnamed protein product [Clonostachys rosea f. rosea IK726]